MSRLRLYPPVKVVGQSFSSEKLVVVPNQSMSLKEILIRFSRKEALPVSHEVFYAENMGDLEKIAREDVTVRHERAVIIKANLAKAKARKEERERGAKGGEASVPPTPPSQMPPEVPPGTPPPGTPPVQTGRGT